jgi:DNA-binding CsgD family transcriptional regulator
MADTELISLIYDAALSRDRWGDVLVALSDRVGGWSAAAVMQDEHTGEGSSIDIRTDPAVWEDYFGYFATKNVLLKGAADVKPGSVVTEDDLCARDVLHRSEYYKGFLHANQMDHMLGLTVWRDGPQVCIVNIMRPQSRGAYGAEEIGFAREVIPHVAKAFQVSMITSRSEGWLEREPLLDVMAQGAILLDRHLRPMYANRNARILLENRDGVVGKAAGIEAEARPMRDALSAILIEAGQGRGGALRLPRSSGKAPLQALAVPLARRPEWLGVRRPAILLLLADPTSEARPSTEILRGMFGLTAAEANFCQEMLSGADVATCAARLGIGIATARQHLSRSLAKTGAKRQGELIRLIAMTGQALA